MKKVIEYCYEPEMEEVIAAFPLISFRYFPYKLIKILFVLDNFIYLFIFM